MSESLPLIGVTTALTSMTIVDSHEYQASPPRSATMRGIAGLTMVWLMDAVNMPITRPK